jgi:hypothetical protein
MQEAKQKDIGLRVWMDYLSQRWFLSKILMFFSLFGLQDYERTVDRQEIKEEYTRKWICKEKVYAKIFSLTLHHHFAKLI